MEIEPRFISRRAAAAWAGVSIPTWNLEVKAGKWPMGVPTGAKGGRLRWDLTQLKAMADSRATLGGPIDDYEVARAEAAARRQRNLKTKG